MLRAESRRHNSLRSDKCPLFSNAFSREPRGTDPGIHSRLSLKAGRRVPFAKFLKLTFRHTYRYFLAINNSTANRSDNLPVFTASSDSTQNST